MPRPDGKPYNFEKPQAVRVVVKPAKAPAVALEVVDPEPIKEPNKGGRPVALKADAALVADVVAKVEGGLHVDTALVLAGIASGSVDHFLKRYPKAAEAFKQAEGRFEQRMIAHIERAAGRDHKAAAWLLERRNAAKWAQTTKAELTGKGGAPIASLTLSKTLLATVANGPDRAKRKRATDV